MKFAAAAALALVCASAAGAAAQRQASVTLEALILAEDRRASNAGDYDLLAGVARSHADPVMRARGVRALGRLEQSMAGRQPADLIERALRDPNAHVRRTAAYALAQSVNALDAAAKVPRRGALLAHLAQEDDDAVAGALLESAARLTDGGSVTDVETAVLSQAAGAPRAAAQASALEILARRAGKPGVLSGQSLEWLRGAVFAPSLPLSARRAALQALVTARAVDAVVANRAFASDDWQIRRLAVAGAIALPNRDQRTLEPPNPVPPNLIDRALRDPDAHVRYEAVLAVARRGVDACAVLASVLQDADAHVALAAIDALARCADPAVTAALSALTAAPGGVNWHRASHALVALASVDPARARAILSPHASDAAWPVRMYAAMAAARLPDDTTLVTLAADPHSNVREAAIAGLVARVKDSADPATARTRLADAVRAALAERRDPQLLRTAAGAIAATGDPAAFKTPLLDAIDALDMAGADTTVDARVALIEALTLAAPGDAPPAPPARRALLTPSVQELQRLPVRARIEMARGGVIELELLPDEAPATVARFARLARAGYYDGLTFHRVVPNFVVQGGSPWANEYAGAPRFQRDELGFARHEWGAVGISTRGRDTGDAQLFIDLVDLPRLNHDYTVFARVVSGMDVVDAILEADVIQRISILK